jgi:hypothetical protein
LAEGVEVAGQRAGPGGGLLAGRPALAVVAGAAAEAFAEGGGEMAERVEAGGGGNLAHRQFRRDQEDPGVLQPDEGSELHHRTAEALVELPLKLALRDA